MKPNDQAQRSGWENTRNCMNATTTPANQDAKPKPDAKPLSLKRMVRRMACKCGWHEWVSDYECIESTTDKGTLVIIWWNCNHCWETKLKCLLR